MLGLLAEFTAAPHSRLAVFGNDAMGGGIFFVFSFLYWARYLQPLPAGERGFTTARLQKMRRARMVHYGRAAEDAMNCITETFVIP